VIDETHPLFLGCAALSAGDFVHQAIAAADLIINVGHDVIEKPPFFMQNGGTQVIHVSTNTAEVDPVYFPQIEVIGDIANALWQMKNDIVPSGRWSFDAMLAARKAEVEHTASMCDDQRFPIFPPAWCSACARRCPPTASSASTTASTKSGSPAIIRRASPTPCCSTMRWRRWAPGLPSAMASQWSIRAQGDGDLRRRRLHDEQPGDGDRGPPRPQHHRADPQRFELRHDRWKQANMGFEDWGLTYGNPDFVKYAESYGANGHRWRARKACRTC
jgi:acetolactate synthase-1/2/3 large subunit